MTTYEKIQMLCRREGFAISNLGEKVPGVKITRGAVSGWKKGAVPSAAVIKAVSEYFDVTPEYLTTEGAEAAFNTVYEKVITQCRKKGVSRSKMADDIGISRSTPKDWENGKVTPRYDTIKKLADYFGVSVAYFTENHGDTIESQNITDNHGIIGHTHAPVTIINDSERKLTEQEIALLELFGKMDVVKQAQLLVRAAELLDE